MTFWTLARSVNRNSVDLGGVAHAEIERGPGWNALGVGLIVELRRGVDHPAGHGYAASEPRQVVLAVEIELHRRDANRRIAVVGGIRRFRQPAFDPAHAADDTQSLDRLPEHVEFDATIALFAIERKHPGGRIEEAARLLDLEAGN